MSKRSKTGLLLAAFLTALLLSFYTTNGQSFYNKKYAHKLILHAGTGTSHYFGDLVDNWYFTVNGNFTAGIRYPVWDRISVAADATWFMLHAEDSKSPTKAPRNLSFFSNDVEIAGTVHVDLFPEPVRFYRRKMFNPYIFGGAGLLLYGPKATYNGQVYSLRPLETEGKKYSAYTWSFPAGIGIRFKLNAFINLTAEAGVRYTMTDYLDDVSSGIFLDPNSFTDPIARALADRSGEYGMNPTMSQLHRNVRGNPKKNDAYGLMLFRVEYYLSPLRDSFKAIMYQGRKTKMRRGRR
jgi:hypothetical protein